MIRIVVAAVGLCGCWSPTFELAQPERVAAPPLEEAPSAPPALIGSWNDTCLLREQRLTCWKVDTRTPTVREVHQVAGRWRAVSVGPELTCALDDASALWCWGRNASGVLGARPVEGSATPVLIDATRPWVSVAAGSGYACAIDAEQAMACFGAADWGVANPPPPPNRSRPRSIPGRFTAVSANWYTTTAIAADGTLWSAENDDHFAPVLAAKGATFTRVIQGVHGVAAATSPEQVLLIHEGGAVTVPVSGSLFAVGYLFCGVNEGQLGCRDSLGVLPSSRLPLERTPSALSVSGYVPCWLEPTGAVRCSVRGTEKPIDVPLE